MALGSYLFITVLLITVIGTLAVVGVGLLPETVLLMHRMAGAKRRHVAGAESAQRHYSDTLDILGAEGVLAPGAADTPFGGKFEHDFRAAVVTTVYGGASEILREIIAERRLGLPRNRPAS